jgi:hypothetical protein
MNRDEQARRRVAQEIEEEAARQTERDAEAQKCDFVQLSDIRRCPRCDGELDEGYITMLRGSVWSKAKPGGFLEFRGLSKPLTVVGWTRPAFPALRCRRCHFVVFDYTSEVEKGTVRE